MDNELAGILAAVVFGAGAVVAFVKKEVVGGLIAAGGALLSLAEAVKAL